MANGRWAEPKRTPDGAIIKFHSYFPLGIGGRDGKSAITIGTRKSNCVVQLYIVNDCIPIPIYIIFMTPFESKICTDGDTDHCTRQFLVPLVFGSLPSLSPIRKLMAFILVPQIVFSCGETKVPGCQKSMRNGIFSKTVDL